MIRRILFIALFFLASLGAVAQSVPQSFSYQAVARDGNGDLLTNEPINVKLSILDGSSIGTELYVELHHNVQTNDLRIKYPQDLSGFDTTHKKNIWVIPCVGSDFE